MKMITLMATLAFLVPTVAAAADAVKFRSHKLVAKRMEWAYNTDAQGGWRSQMRDSTNRPVSFGRVICSSDGYGFQINCNGSFTYEGVRTTAKWMLWPRSANRAFLNWSYWQRGRLVNAGDEIIAPRQLALTRF